MVVFVVALYPPNGGASRFWPLKALKGTKILVETQGHPALAAPCLGDAFLLLAGFWVVPGSAELQPPGQEVEQQGGSKRAHRQPLALTGAAAHGGRTDSKPPPTPGRADLWVKRTDPPGHGLAVYLEQP